MSSDALLRHWPKPIRFLVSVSIRAKAPGLADYTQTNQIYCPEPHNEMSSQFPHLQTQFARPLPQLNAKTSPSSSTLPLSLSRSSEYSMASTHPQALIAVGRLRCSRCVKSVETIVRRASDGTARVSMADVSANGMVRFGHNLYYCSRCAKLVGYK